MNDVLDYRPIHDVGYFGLCDACNLDIKSDLSTNDLEIVEFVIARLAGGGRRYYHPTCLPTGATPIGDRQRLEFWTEV